MDGRNGTETVEPRCLWLEPGPDVPNNPDLPVLVYVGVVGEAGGGAVRFERRFAANGWEGLWRDGIFAFPHYHSTAHEALGIARGSATLRLGGLRGVTLAVRAGDALVLPAGIGHERLSSSPDLLVVGAYPPGRSWDLLRGGQDVEGARGRVAAVPLPPTDPLFGADGPLIRIWPAAASRRRART